MFVFRISKQTLTNPHIYFALRRGISLDPFNAAPTFTIAGVEGAEGEGGLRIVANTNSTTTTENLFFFSFDRGRGRGGRGRRDGGTVGEGGVLE